MDTPSEEELIASSHSIEQIREFVGADSLAYLSLDALREAVADTKGDYCHACYTGDHPTKLVQIASLKGASRRR